MAKSTGETIRAVFAENGMNTRIGGLNRKNAASGDKALAADLALLAGPFQTPSSTVAKRVDVNALPKGGLATALAKASQSLLGAGEGAPYLEGVFAVYGKGRAQEGPPLGYAVIAYGGDDREAWSAAEYFDNAGRSLGRSYDTA